MLMIFFDNFEWAKPFTRVAPMATLLFEKQREGTLVVSQEHILIYQCNDAFKKREELNEKETWNKGKSLLIQRHLTIKKNKNKNKNSSSPSTCYVSKFIISMGKKKTQLLLITHLCKKWVGFFMLEFVGSMIFFHRRWIDA